MKTAVYVIIQLYVLLHKGYIFIKHGNSSISGIYTKLFIYTKKVYVSLKFQFCLSKILMKFIP